MLLTLKSPSRARSKVRMNILSSGDQFCLKRPSLTTNSSPPSPLRQAVNWLMDTSHRGLPPPSAMTLPPDSGRTAITPVTQLPPPSPQWNSGDESMRQWLQAKVEEDRRGQEEEKTRQESLRLEQRRTEQSMLRESFQAGVPLHLVPMIFAGFAGGNLCKTWELVQPSVDQTSPHSQQLPPLPLPQLPLPSSLSSQQQQQPQSQVQQLQLPSQQQQQQQSPHHVNLPQQQQQRPQPSQSPHQQPPQSLQQPASQLPTTQPPQPRRRSQPQTFPTEIRRDNRAIPPNPYAIQQVPLTNSNLAGASQPPVSASPTQQPFGRNPTSLLHTTPTDSHPPPVVPLSRINTTEMHINRPPTNVGAMGYNISLPGPPPPPPQSQPSPAASTKQETQQQPSPSIYFHHWVPPGQSQPNTPKNQLESTPAAHAHSHLRSEFQGSPGRKRKAQGAHPTLPPPPSSETSPAGQHYSPRQNSPGRVGRRTNAHFRQISDGTEGVQGPRYRDAPELESDSAPRSIRSAPEPASHSSTSGPERNQANTLPRSAGTNGSTDRIEDPIHSVAHNRYVENHSPSQRGLYSSFTHGQEGNRNSASSAAVPPRLLEDDQYINS